jgi:hypothetical protein
MDVAANDHIPKKKRTLSMLGDPAALAEESVAKSPLTARKQAEVWDSDPFANPVSNSEQGKAKLYSDKIKAAMGSADIFRLAICLPFIQANNFSRAIAEEVGLLQKIKEVSDNHEFPETVLEPCKSLLESWKNGSDCEDRQPGRLKTQRVGDGEANDDGSAATQDPSPDVDDLLYAVDG